MNDPYLTKLLTKNEKVVFQTRQHWLSLALQILPEILSSTVITTLITIISRNWVPRQALPWAYLLNLIPLASLLRDVLRWRYHKYVITNRRIIHLSGIIAKNVSDSSLEKVNDVNLEQTFLGRIFDFGNLEILTASELGMERYVSVAFPIQFKKALLEAGDEN
ncbi:MAG: PH domain-containing protein [Anaerolineaceae bacterium]|nr:PH domain-containing protein [Anaerolineaceae bacterium]